MMTQGEFCRAFPNTSAMAYSSPKKSWERDRAQHYGIGIKETHAHTSKRFDVHRAETFFVTLLHDDFDANGFPVPYLASAQEPISSTVIFTRGSMENKPALQGKLLDIKQAQNRGCEVPSRED